MKSYRFIYTLIMGGLLLFGGGLPAQDTAANAAVFGFSLTTNLLILLFGLTLLCLFLTMLLWVLVRQIIKKEGLAETEEAPSKPWFTWKWVQQKINDAVPIAEEGTIDMGHAYDGIRELDNNLPPWWKYGFYITIVVGFIYFGYWHMGSDWSSDKQYQEEMAEAEVIRQAYLEKVANMVNEHTAQPLDDARDLSAGEALYVQNCLACHGAEGQGGIGPNFADEYWLHGGDIKDLFRTIKYGVPEKGMISWQERLKPKEMQQVASYILTFQGTQPPNPKAPQGTLYVPSDTVSTDSVLTQTIIETEPEIAS